jgi:hypothetical protein
VYDQIDCERVESQPSQGDNGEPRQRDALLLLLLLLMMMMMMMMITCDLAAKGPVEMAQE